MDYITLVLGGIAFIGIITSIHVIVHLCKKNSELTKLKDRDIEIGKILSQLYTMGTLDDTRKGISRLMLLWLSR